ncbi:MAG: nitric-oxide reductase [Crocinitomicaceae bacterium]|nr:nitric-oxide reductase [Crocinitomicaceae bacterium]|tara:strand:+ start:1563 stop:2000 length:438 start_codon:yes stop_codon:yes gene_type:complete
MSEPKNFVRQNRLTIVTILFLACIYTGVVYTHSSEEKPNITERALKGQILWQKNNCTACHQLYGLGGYLGPDLTNIHSSPKKGPAYIKAFLNSGVKMMPNFNFTEEEKDQLIAFLEAVDRTGIYPNLNAKIKANGWVEIETRDEK